MILSRTRTRAFLSVLPLVLFLTVTSSAALSGQGTVPRPQDVFGFKAGADYKLASDSQIVEYFHRLAAASDRVKVVDIGRSVLGRPMILAFISSAANIRRLDHWREVNERLALARGLNDDQAHKLANEGKVIVWVDGGLHASEVAGAQHSPLLAYRVATEETPEMRQIRDNVILLLMPVMNPDGLDIVKDWYDKTLNTPYQDTRPPVLWHFYAGHDNNRDWYMMNLPETRAVAKVLYQEWYPQIVYNQHQTAPFPARIFIPPFADPVNPNIPARVTRGVNQVGIAMGQRLTEKNMPGAVSRINFDMWWNGGMRTAPYFHNMVGILTETAHATATPINYDPKSFPEFFRGSTVRTTDPSVFYPDPWKGGMFRLRDAVDYMVESGLATLNIAAKLKEDWLYDAYAMARDALKAGEAGGPFAYVIRADQRNEREAVELVNTLRRNGLEVQHATRSFRAGGKEYAAGAYVVPAAQPFRADVVDLMDKQVYPDMRQYPGGPPDPPYDMTGWTLPIQMDVAVDRIDEPFRARGLQTVQDTASVAAGTVKGNAGYGWVLSHASNASAIAVNRLLEAGESVAWAGSAFQAGGQQFVVGDIVVKSGAATADRISSLARSLGLDFTGLDRAPDVTLRTLKQPRIGIYKSWRGNMDEGWTRWVLDQYEFPYDTLHDDQIRHADLSQYDAIILPDDRPQSILHGNAPGTMPEQYTGGMGLDGAAALQRFVEQGGLVLALDGATDFAIEQFGLPVRDATAGLSPQQLYVPGTLVGITTDPTEPIAYGMPENAAAFFVRSRAFSVTRTRSDAADVPTAEVVVRYARKNLLRSGWELGGDRYLAGRPAVVRVHMGKGDVVLVGFRAQFRGQPRGTFKLLFNALQGASLDQLPMAAHRNTAGSSR
ncbi:MAG: M14 family zinc carboxypeptidase [Gemmatimonadota bacterium]